jgi:hypothetical protein
MALKIEYLLEKESKNTSANFAIFHVYLQQYDQNDMYCESIGREKGSSLLYQCE